MHSFSYLSTTKIVNFLRDSHCHDDLFVRKLLICKWKSNIWGFCDLSQLWSAVLTLWMWRAQYKLAWQDKEGDILVKECCTHTSANTHPNMQAKLGQGCAMSAGRTGRIPNRKSTQTAVQCQNDVIRFSFPLCTMLSGCGALLCKSSMPHMPHSMCVL